LAMLHSVRHVSGGHYRDPCFGWQLLTDYPD
jgi:hypothetical protein